VIPSGMVYERSTEAIATSMFGPGTLTKDSIPAAWSGKLAMRDVERIVLGRGSVTRLVNLWHGLEPLKVVLLVRSPILEVRIWLGRNRNRVRGFLGENVLLLREWNGWSRIWNRGPLLFG